MTKIKRHGATAVEFALVLPLILVVVFGGVELTRVSMLRHTANHAAYKASRDAIIPGAVVTDVITSAEDHLAVIGVRDAVVSVEPSTITEDTSLVTVSVAFPISSNSFIVPEFASGEIMGQSAMVTERSRSRMATNLPTPPAPTTIPVASPADTSPPPPPSSTPPAPTTTPPPPPPIPVL